MSVVRRLAVVTLAVTLFATGTALAGRYDPRRELIPADQARAAAMLPRTADLGRGYKPDTSPTTWTSRTCAGIDESGLTLTGERFAPVWISSTSIVVAVARLYESVADADRSWRLEFGRSGVECHSAPSGGTPVTVSRLAFPSLASRTVAFRTRFTPFAGGTRSVGDVIAIQRGRARVMFTVVTSAKSPPSRALEIRLARIVAARQAKAMHGA